MTSPSPNLALQQQYFNTAYELLDRGLSLDEAERYEDALSFYRQAVRQLQLGISINFTKEEEAQAAELRHRMTLHLDRANERIAILEDYLRPSIFTKLRDQLLSILPDIGTDTDSRTSQSSFALSLAHSAPVQYNYRKSQPTTTYKRPQSQDFTYQLHSSAPSTVARAPSSTQRAHLDRASATEAKSRSISVTSKQTPSKTQLTALEQQLKAIDKRLRELILNEMIEQDTGVEWDKVVGLDAAKQTLEESVIWPMLRRDLFTGLRAPPKGVLLYGPPGNGKTYIAKALARRSNARFFNVSAATLTSKYVGESEQLVRALFLIAKYLQPSVVFIDEIDSILTARRSDEHESFRRMKTEFLVQMDGCTSSDSDQVLLLAATNRPWDIDDAALRRMAKRIYIPLPNTQARGQLLLNLLSSEKYNLSSKEFSTILNSTEGYSFAELKALCAEAAMGPIRELTGDQILSAEKSNLRPIMFSDFAFAIKKIRPVATAESLRQYADWSSKFGTL